MSSTCSSWRRRSPCIARASSGSKPSIVMVVRNMRGASRGVKKAGRELYRNGAAAALGRGAPPARKARARRKACLHQVFDDRGPGLGEIVAVVSPASQGEHPTVTETVGERGQLAGRAPVYARREAQVGDRIALETVGAALQDDEFRRELLQVRGDVRPDAGEHLVVGTGG